MVRYKSDSARHAMSCGSSMSCRLAELGLSTSGRKADLEQRLHNACNGQAGASSSAGMGTQMSNAPNQVSRVPNKQPSSAVFKAGKRKNFVRINLKVCLELIDTAIDVRHCMVQWEFH